jgi:hypothetical protein
VPGEGDASQPARLAESLWAELAEGVAW